MNEIWRDIKGYEGLYQVSNEGRVRNGNGHVMKTFKKNKDKDYQQLVLCKNNVKKTHSLHRLVAFAFPEICGEWFEGADVDHIDGNAGNNRADNLKFVTHIDNIRNPNTKSKTYGHKTRKRSIDQLTLNGEYIRTWERIKDASNHYGFHASNISSVLAGKYAHTHGFKWRYSLYYPHAE